MGGPYPNTFKWYDSCIYDKENVACGYFSTSLHLFYCDKFACPSHFKCPETYCIPVRHLCDGVTDCPSGGDEGNCANYSCPGYFYCPVEGICLSGIDVCDGYRHCFETGDDELLCDILNLDICPHACLCIGYFIDCVNASLVKMTIHMENVFTLILRENIISNFLLEHFHPFFVHLDLSFNKLGIVAPSIFTKAPNLLYFNVNSNKLKKLDKQPFLNATQVKFIDFSSNPLNSLRSLSFIGLVKIPRLYISHTGLSKLRNYVFLGLNSLHMLSLVNNSIDIIESNVFTNLTHLQFLFIQQHNIIAFETLHFSDLKVKLTIKTNQYGFCCKIYHTKTITCKEIVSSASFCVSKAWPPIWYTIIIIMLLTHTMHIAVRFHKVYQNSMSIFLTNYSISHNVFLFHYAFRIILAVGQYTITDFNTFNLCLVSGVISCIFIVGMLNEVCFKLIFTLYRAYIIESIHIEESRLSATFLSVLVWVCNTAAAILFIRFAIPIREYCFLFSRFHNIAGLTTLLSITLIVRTVDIVITVLSILKVYRKRIAASREETMEEKELRIRNFIDIIFTTICHFAMTGLLLALTFSRSQQHWLVFSIDTVIVMKSLVTVILLTFATRTFKDVMTNCFTCCNRENQNISHTKDTNPNSNQDLCNKSGQIPCVSSSLTLPPTPPQLQCPSPSTSKLYQNGPIILIDDQCENI